VSNNRILLRDLVTAALCLIALLPACVNAAPKRGFGMAVIGITVFFW
jgi:hypothetical protein